MGYTTEFFGRFELNKELDKETSTYLTKFAGTRHMKRKLPKKFGHEGEFYVEDEEYKETKVDTILDHNTPPDTQPGLWCQWIPSEDNKGIEWDGGEKFYHYVEWLEYIVKNFLAPKGYVLNGEVEFQGESNNDKGIIIVDNNVVSVDTWESLKEIKKENKRLRVELGLQEAILKD